MNITLKGLKHSKFASQGTPCFEATVHVDGNKAFRAENAGRGGANRYDNYKLAGEIEAKLGADPDCTRCNGTGRVAEEDMPFARKGDKCFCDDLEARIFGLVYDADHLKKLRRMANSKKKVYFMKAGKLYSRSVHSSQTVDLVMREVENTYPGTKFLRGMTDKEMLAIK